MPESQLMSSTVPVALLYQGDDLGGHLRNALRDLGAAVVYEALATNLDRGALEGSGARIVVFNLDSHSDAQLDHVYDVLDEGDYEVVFNDADVSGQLSGSDQARWARHLAAKILHKPEIAVPARPAWAESVPTPAQKLAALAARPIAVAAPAPVVAAAVAQPMAAEAPLTVAETTPAWAEPVAAAAQTPTLELPIADVFAAAEGYSPSAATAETPTLEVPVLDVFSAAELYPPAEAASAEAAEQDFSAALEDFARHVPSHSYAAAPAHDFAGEIDALFGDSRAVPAAAPPPVQDAPAAALDIESLFGEMSLPDSAASAKTAFDQYASAADAIPEAEDRSFKPGRLPSEAPVEAPAATASLLPTDWSLEPFTEDAQAAAVPTGKASFGVDLMSASEFLAPEDDGGANTITQLPVADALSLELMPMEDAVAPSAYSNAPAESAITAQEPEAAQPLKVGTGVELKHVFVLGASIGGPEAVREFLGALPPRFPVLFVLVQHMGDEFLELMSAQLARAVSLTVRTPTHGERFGHGEIVIVTTKQRLQIDPEGVATLSALPERSAYSPSIDLVLRDIADQFGARAGAIVFSGMAQDAITGSSYLKSKGGVVWTQDPNTCTISTMVDAVTQTGAVSFSGSPQALAAKMIADYGAD